MPRHSMKSQYNKIDQKIIYALVSPLSKEFFIGHCKKTLIKDVFKHHSRGDRRQTKDCLLKLKEQSLHPCLFVLEEVECTKVEAYRFVIAWTKILIENGYICLDQGNISHYMNDLFEDTQTIYTARKFENIREKCNCDTCIVSNYGRKKCALYKGDMCGK